MSSQRANRARTNAQQFGHRHPVVLRGSKLTLTWNLDVIGNVPGVREVKGKSLKCSGTGHALWGVA
jgi:hypothetical protein